MSNTTSTSAKVIPFDYQSIEIRTIKREDGSVWFVAKDITDILGLTNTTKALKNLDDDERSNQRLGRQGVTNVINESGLYTLILRSNKPEAKPFRKWVTSEVLPTIRKTGTYTLPTLTPAQQRQIQKLVGAKASQGTPDGKADKGAFIRIYGSIKDHFRVAKYSQVPESRFDELVAFLGGSIPRGKAIPGPQPGLSDEDRQEVWDNLVISCREIEDFFGYIHAHIPKMLMALSRMSNSESILFTDLMIKHKQEWNQQNA